MNYGDFPIEKTIHMLFTTRAFATGIPGTLSAATVAVYEDITATPIETSVAVTESLNSIAGLNAVPIVAIAASGYEVGKNYHVVIEAGTVDSVSVVGEVIGYFSIGRSAAAVDLANSTDGLSAIKTSVDNIGTSSGGSVNIQATEDNTGGAIIDGVTFVGSVQSGTFSSTEAEDGTLHDIDDVADDIDIVYGFSVGGGRTASSVSFAGFIQGNGDQMAIEVYDHIGADWEVIATIAGQNGTSNIFLEAPLLLKHTGTGSELGKVYIRFDTNSTTPSNLSVDQILVSAVNIGQSVGYSGGQIWVNTNASNTNTESFVDGVADNPVSTIAAAKTISTAVGLGDFHIINGSSITLAENSSNESYFGDNWTLAIGGQTVTGCHFSGAVVSGVAVGAAEFDHCEIGTITTIADTHFSECSFTGTVTLPVGNVYIDNGHHAGSVVLDFGAAVGSTTVHIHKWAGGIEFQNFGDNGTDIVHLDGQGKLTINANSSGGTINLRGNWDIDDLDGNAVINYDDQSQGYDGGQIWIDTVGGTAGTNDHINGTSDTPCLTITDAKTLSTSTGLSDFHIINGSAIVLGESTDNESYFGDNWTLDLSDESVDGAHFVGATVSGAGPSAAVVNYEGCNFTTASIALGHFDFCAFAGTLTQTTAGIYEYHNCYSKGTTAPVFTKTAGQAIDVEFHNYSGDITISGLQSGDTIELGGFFRTIILNGADATVHVHGHYEVLTNNLTGSPTVSITGAIQTSDVAKIPLSDGTNSWNATALAAMADEQLDRTDGIEGGANSMTLRQAMRIILAAVGGKADGLATTTVHYRDVNDGKNRITATVDTDGNRTTITYDKT